MRAAVSSNSSLVKTVRYGTKYFPAKKDVIANGPSTSSIMSTPLMSTERWSQPPEEEVVSRKDFPSITFIQGCMDDKKALLLWETKMIKEMGMPAFRKWKGARAGAGSSFHKTAKELISEFTNNGSIRPQSSILSECKESVQGYVRSIYPLISSLSPDPTSFIAEKDVYHHRLQYKGRFDAVFRYKDELFMVDWKTASVHSAVSKNMEGSDDLAGLYGYPRQLAAYVGAFNTDPSYEGREQIKRAAVIMAYDDGTDAKVLEMNSVQLEENWQGFLKQVDSYYRALEVEEDTISFVCTG